MSKLTISLDYIENTKEKQLRRGIGIAFIITAILTALIVMVNAYRDIQVQEQKTEQEEMKRKYIETWEKLQEIDQQRKQKEADNTAIIIETAQVKQLDTAKIKELYQSVNSPLTEHIDWLAQECDKRGLNYKLVIAIQTQESGYGRYCHKGNCFGYGATDSGNIDKWFGGDYETITLMILDSLAVHYKVQTAEEMSALGYNTRQSWIDNVNYFINKF
jgi:hypothetical protein